MTRRAAIPALLLALCALALGATTAAGAAQAGTATAPTPKTTLYDVEQQVMCVTCRTSLAVAGGPQAEDQRDLIRRLIAEGKTTAQIKAALVDEYGEQVLALPEEKGFNVAAYLVPIAVVVVALALAVLFLPRWRRRARAFAGAQPTPLGPELDADDARRLDEDLQRYD